MHQTRCHIAAITAVDFHQRVVSFFQLKQRPLGGIAVQVRHSLLHQR
jgi:hypothetical protein